MRQPKCLAILVLAALLSAASPSLGAPPGEETTAEPAPERRPPRVPVVAVGSKITWNVPYVAGADEQRMLDIYAPPEVRDAPVVVYAHRGEWAKGDKSEVCYKPKFLNENGVVFVSVNYRLSGVARHPAQVDDVAAAVRWVKDHIAEYGGAPDRIVLMGHSAGCHIVTMVGLDPRPLAKVALRPADLWGVVSWSGGAFDLPAKVAAGGMYRDYIHANFGADEGDLRDASPVTHAAAPGEKPRFLFVSAGEGKPESRELSERMVELIRSTGGRAEAVTLAGKTHFLADYECGMPDDAGATGRILLDFIRGEIVPAK